MFTMDAYGPMYAASASGAMMLSRYLLSAAFPLFAPGFIAVAISPIPCCFWWKQIVQVNNLVVEPAIAKPGQVHIQCQRLSAAVIGHITENRRTTAAGSQGPP
ncbi:hypothetical protein C2857_004946 [Epichloe festucae Fl1]|uniref:Uncharacterized protein n=1 Tax=Epichloe festucae (strain Fl1) TaxID=877507 RepID=A0A7S9KPC1_EPIFF|nr:hypothetical protein C2857_004946 [Epichloe festucae Fl1]